MLIDLGKVKPGSTLRIPFSSFDKDDGSSITMTNYAVGDILIYKDGSTTERASTSGFTATTDFDAKTGKHLIIIDLADDTTADFFKAGSEYLVALDAVTVDAVTVGGWIARFRIGYDGAFLDTSIATLASQTSFTLTSGPAEDDALNGCVCLIHDKASAVQCGFAVVSDYTGASKTVTLLAGATFAVAAIDNISFFRPTNVEWWHALAVSKVPLAPTTAGRDLDVSAGGEGGVDWANVGSPTTVVGLSGTSVKTATDVETDTQDIQARLPAALTANGNIKADTLRVNGTAQTAGDIPAMITTVDDFVDTEIADIQARLPAALTANGNIKADTLRVGGTLQTAGDLMAAITIIDDFLDTEIAAIKAKTDNLPAAPAAVSDIPTAAANAAALMDLVDGVETGVTPRQALRLMLAAMAGKLSGAATATITIRNVGDSKDRITATVDASGNRSAVTTDGT